MLGKREQARGRRRWIVAVGICVLLIAASVIAPVRGWFGRLLVPLFVTAHRGTGSVSMWLEEHKTLQEANAEITRLRSLSEELLVDKADLARLTKENEDLKLLVDYKVSMSYKLLVAKVAGADISPVRMRLVVDQGTLRGVREGLPVVSAGGLFIGTVEAADAGTSVIRLLPDPKSKIGAVVQGKDATAGVLTVVEGGALALRFVNESVKIIPGDPVMTSSMTSQVPAGIPIGMVESVVRDEDAPFQRALIDTVTAWETMRYVGILVPTSL